MVPLEPEVQYKVDHSNAAANLAARDAGESRWILPVQHGRMTLIDKDRG